MKRPKVVPLHPDKADKRTFLAQPTRPLAAEMDILRQAFPDFIMPEDYETETVFDGHLRDCVNDLMRHIEDRFPTLEGMREKHISVPNLNCFCFGEMSDEDLSAQLFDFLEVLDQHGPKSGLRPKKFVIAAYVYEYSLRSEFRQNPECVQFIHEVSRSCLGHYEAPRDDVIYESKAQRDKDVITALMPDETQKAFMLRSYENRSSRESSDLISYICYELLSVPIGTPEGKSAEERLMMARAVDPFLIVEDMFQNDSLESHYQQLNWHFEDYREQHREVPHRKDLWRHLRALMGIANLTDKQLYQNVMAIPAGLQIDDYQAAYLGVMLEEMISRSTGLSQRVKVTQLQVSQK